MAAKVVRIAKVGSALVAIAGGALLVSQAVAAVIVVQVMRSVVLQMLG